MNRFYFIVFLLLFSLGKAQQLQYNDQRLGKWMSFRSNTWLTKNVAMYAERNYRHYTLLPNIEQFAFRIGAFYRADSSHFMFGGGYASLKNISPATEIVEIYQTEMRLWQHISYTNTMGRVLYDFRYRLEERLIDDEDFYLRHRIRFQNSIPLTKKKLEKNAIFIQSDVELFLNSKEPLYNRSRYNVLLGWMAFSNIQLLAGFSGDFDDTYNRKYFNFTFAYEVDLTKYYKKK
jgi:hypothetical protein